MFVVLVVSGMSEATPAEGLTPFRFFMARAYGQPEEHTVMRFIRFKPSDGAKFRETFEQKHGPRGRDLIESLGQGSYIKLSATVTDDPPRNTKIQVSPVGVRIDLQTVMTISNQNIVHINLAWHL